MMITKSELQPRADLYRLLSRLYRVEVDQPLLDALKELRFPQAENEILAEGYDTKDTGFADTDAFRWLSAYAADYGFILRWPEDRQAATGMVFEPWHWRYVGVENARAMFASGLSLEEFLAVSRLG